MIVLKEVTVTAQRREQKAKDVPVSLRVLSREDLEGRIAKRLEDAFVATPNASMTSQRGGNDASDLSICGVSTTAFGADPSVSVYVDDVYVGNDNGFNARMSDLEQVEILRGPQGTLYGRNAVGGAVNVRTAAPELGVNSAGMVQAGVGKPTGWSSAAPRQMSRSAKTPPPASPSSAIAATAGCPTPRAVRTS